MLKKNLLLIFIFASSLGFSQTSSLYLKIVDHTHRCEYQEIISLAPEIAKIKDVSDRNDLLLALSQAYLNMCKFQDFKNTLNSLTEINHSQSGTVNQLLGIHALIDQNFRKAEKYFKTAADEFALVERDVCYYEACNNLAYTQLMLTNEDPATNLLLDQVIEYCNLNKDSTLLARALINKSKAYPYDAVHLLNEAYHIGPSSLKSTALYLTSISTNQPTMLSQALELNPLIETTCTVPLKWIEKAEIKLLLAKKTASKAPREANKILLGALRDSIALPLKIKDRIYQTLANSYDRLGSHDSSTYYQNKISLPEEIEETEVTLAKLKPSFGSGLFKKQGNGWFLGGAIIMAVVSLILGYALLFKNKQLG